MNLIIECFLTLVGIEQCIKCGKLIRGKELWCKECREK